LRMSIHWTLIAGFLYAEIGTILLLLVPFISTKMWNKVFKSRFLRGLESQLIYYFYVLVAILILFFLDAIREMQKYSAEETQQKTVGMSHLDTQMQMHMRLFRAQRNFYIAGFALFLCLVIKRLVGLISANAGLQDAKPDGIDASGDVADMKAELEKAKKEAEAAKKDMNSMKSQSESLAKEYDRLMEEKDKLQLKVNVMGGDKKDD